MVRKQHDNDGVPPPEDTTGDRAAWQAGPWRAPGTEERHRAARPFSMPEEDDALMRAFDQASESPETARPAPDTDELSSESLAILLDRLGDVRPHAGGPVMRSVPSGEPRAEAPPWRAQCESAAGTEGTHGAPQVRVALGIAAGLLACAAALWFTRPMPRAQRQGVEAQGPIEQRTAPVNRTPQGVASPVAETPVASAATTARKAPIARQRAGATLPAQPAAAASSAHAPASPVPAGAEARELPPRAPRGTLRVRAGGAARAYLRGKLLGRVPGELQLEPGRHRLLFRTSQGRRFFRTVRVRAGQTVAVQLP